MFGELSFEGGFEGVGDCFEVGVLGMDFVVLFVYLVVYVDVDEFIVIDGV